MIITEDTRIDPERIGDIIMPSVSGALREVYGSEFCRANTEECLILVEAIALSLRVGGAFCDNLRAVEEDGNMPCGLYTSAAVDLNEGLKLLVALQLAIVERYSVAVFKH